jgi:hypothetical protein
LAKNQIPPNYLVMKFQRLFIISLPRSGSTVLTTMLDQFEDCLCLPESYFPALLESARRDEAKNPDWMAALFLASCLDGSPLSFEEARGCIRDDKTATLEAIESEVARKFGRRPESIRTVVWKYTRFVGRQPDLEKLNGNLIILRRNPLNVFESQFRVPFGEKNRSAARFALFEASYEAAYRHYPRGRTLEVAYQDMQPAIQEILKLTNSAGIKRDRASGGVGDHSGRNPWHSEITKPFKNTDPAKLKNLLPSQVRSYGIASKLLKRLPLVGIAARKVADKREFLAAGRRATAVIARQT